MICVQLNGGLGNQMFQYAFGRALAYKNRTELILDTSQLKNKNFTAGITPRSYELNIFQLKAREATNNDIKRIKPLFYRIANILAFKTGFEGIQTSKYFIEKKFSFNESIEKIGKECFLAGYWQSFRYFQKIESLIQEDFKFQPSLDNKNMRLLKIIKNQNSIGVHIRRSDFVNNKKHNVHGACSNEYYKMAIENITKKISSPYYYIFSDDIDWVRENLKLQYPHKYVSGNLGNRSYNDMQLLSNCKHNIIANSSFSWWAAWLNPNPQKIIIAPKQWFSNEKMNVQANDLIPEEWIRI